MAVVAKPEIVEGTWDEISAQASRFQGRRLRVLILPDADATATAERLRTLNEWLAMPRRPLMPVLDDSRAAIYGEDPDRG